MAEGHSRNSRQRNNHDLAQCLPLAEQRTQAHTTRLPHDEHTSTSLATSGHRLTRSSSPTRRSRERLRMGSRKLRLIHKCRFRQA